MAYDDSYENYGGNDGGSNGSQGVSGPPKKVLSAAAAARLSKKPGIIPGQNPQGLTDAPPDIMSQNAAGQTGQITKEYDPTKPLYAPSPSSKGKPADSDVAPSAEATGTAGVAAPSVDRLSGSPVQDQIPAVVAASMGTEPTEPKLAPQGPQNPILRALSRITGMTAPTPAPGQPYAGPTTTEAKIGTLGKWLGQLGDRGTLAFGSELDRETLLKQKEIEAQKLGHRASLAETQRWHDIMGDVQQQKADVAQQRADTARQQTQASARSKGLVLGDDGSIRPMTPEEILADPILSQNYDIKRTAQNVQQLRVALYQAQTAALTDPNNPKLKMQMMQLEKELKFHQDSMNIALMHLQQGAQGLNLRSQEAGLKQYQPALDAQLRLKTMRQNYQDGLRGDQQAMVSMLMNHIGMTLGAQKGSRVTKDVIREAEQSLPWLERVQKSFDENGVLSGITLSPEQMRQMLMLGEQRYRDTVASSRAGAKYIGVTEEPQWDIDPDSPVSGPLGVSTPFHRAAQPKKPAASGVGKQWNPRTGRYE